MAKLNLIPNRRWLQFRLRTVFIVVTLAAVALGWWKHRHYCLQRAEFHDGMMAIYLLRGEIAASRESMECGQVLLSSKNQWSKEHERCQKVAADHGELKSSFRLAIWRPWIRWSINEPVSDLEYQARLNQ